MKEQQNICQMTLNTMNQFYVCCRPIDWDYFRITKNDHMTHYDLLSIVSTKSIHFSLYILVFWMYFHLCLTTIHLTVLLNNWKVYSNAMDRRHLFAICNLHTICKKKLIEQKNWFEYKITNAIINQSQWIDVIAVIWVQIN